MERAILEGIIVPERIGRHAVVGYLATGGMAELFLGREATGRPVVIKRILPHLSRQGSFVSMFIDEARIGSMVKHPNLVEIHELGQVGSDLFLVMEYLLGESLAAVTRRLVKRGEAMPYALAAHLIAELCDGLHAAHELADDNGNRLELVHRDVSPQNVFVTYGGDVKLLDFGVATATHRLTQTVSGQIKGKYAYMSPEQCRGEALDRRSDLFSLGTVLYELTTLRRLFKRPNELQTMKAICDGAIPAPTREIEGYPACLERVCTRALAHDPDDRYPTAAAMRADLLAAVDELGWRGDPGEALAAKLARWFDDRVEVKRAVLDRVLDGRTIGELPEAEPDEGIELPVVTHLSATALSAVRVFDPSRPSRRRLPRIGRRGALIATAAAITIGVAVGLWLRARGGAAPAPVPDAAARAAFEPAPSDAPLPPSPENVTISLAVTPAGTAVVLGGEQVGVTPFDLHVAKGAQPVALQLRAPGYQPMDQQLVPDKDQRLVLSLVPLPKRPVPVKHPPKGSGSGFHRFD